MRDQKKKPEEKQEHDTEMCGKENKDCENIEAEKQQKAEENKEESGQKFKDIAQFE